MGTPNVMIGILSNLYYNSGSHGSPTWVPVGLVNDLTVPAKWDIAEALSRMSRMKLKVKTMLDVGISGKLLTSATDAAFLAIMAAMLSDDVIDVMALNGPNNVAGVKGWRFDSQVVNASEDQGTGVVVYDDFELIPTPTANAPASVLVSGGSPAPVFTAI